MDDGSSRLSSSTVDRPSSGQASLAVAANNRIISEFDIGLDGSVAFVAGAPQFDDITIMVMQRQPHVVANG